MSDAYGSDYMTIVDEDGTEFELEVLSSLEYNGSTYLAVTLAGSEEEDVEISILKSVEEDGESILAVQNDGTIFSIDDGGRFFNKSGIRPACWVALSE